MNYTALLSSSARLVWQHKFMWLFGLLMGVNSLIFSLAKLSIERSISPDWLNIEAIINGFLDGNLELASDFTSQNLFSWLMAGVLVLFVAVLLIWIVVTIAEGSLISAADAATQDAPIGAGTAFKRGVKLLGRFAALDALVFLPWFLLALTIMLLATAVLFYTIFKMADATVDPRQILTIYGSGMACLVPLTFLLWPVGLISIWYRTLAFRDTAVFNHSAKQAVRHTRAVITEHLGEALLITALLWGLKTVMGWITGALSLPGLAITFMQLTSKGPIVGDGLKLVIGLTTAVVVACLKGVFHAYAATVWTAVYRQWAQKLAA